jgi:hypothetical protein
MAETVSNEVELLVASPLSITVDITTLNEEVGYIGNVTATVEGGTTPISYLQQRDRGTGWEAFGDNTNIIKFNNASITDSARYRFVANNADEVIYSETITTVFTDSTPAPAPGGEEENNGQFEFRPGEFSLVNPISDRTKEYVRKHVFSVVLPEYTNVNTVSIESGTTFGDLYNEYDILFITPDGNYTAVTTYNAEAGTIDMGIEIYTPSSTNVPVPTGVIPNGTTYEGVTIGYGMIFSSTVGEVTTIQEGVIVDGTTYESLYTAYDAQFNTTTSSPFLTLTADDDVVDYIKDGHTPSSLEVKDNNGMVIGKLTKSDNLTINFRYMNIGPLVKKYVITDSATDVPSLGTTTLGDNLTFKYEGPKNIATKLTPSLSTKYKIELANKYVGKMYGVITHDTDMINGDKSFDTTVFPIYDILNEMASDPFNILELDMKLDYTKWETLKNYVTKSMSTWKVTTTITIGAVTTVTHDYVGFNEYNTAAVNDTPVFNVEKYKIVKNIDESVSNNDIVREVSTNTITLTKESIDILLYCIGTVTSKFHEKVQNVVNYRSGDNYTDPLHVLGSYNNLPTMFDSSKIIETRGTNYTEMEFALAPEYDYMKYEDLELSKDIVTSLSDETSSYNVNDLGVEEVLLNTKRSYVDTVTQKMLYNYFNSTGIEDNKSVFTYFEENESDYKNLVKFPSEVEKALPSWLGYDHVNFNAYYTTNDVNLPENKYTDKVSICNERMRDKNLTTVKTIYVSPIIHNFQILGDINIKDLANVEDTKAKIFSKIYKFLDEENDFSNTLYRSNIIEIIESFPEVINANIRLEPYNTRTKPSDQKHYFDIDSFSNNNNTHYIFSAITSKDRERFRNIVLDAITTYIAKYRLNTTTVGSGDTVPINNELDRITQHSIYNNLILGESLDLSGDNIFEYKHTALSKDVTERTFLSELCKPIVSNSETQEIMSVNGYPITKHKLFFMLLANIHNDFLPIIQYNMLNTQGDIDAEYSEEKLYNNGEYHTQKLRGGYSLSNEIVQVQVNCNVKYKGV